MVTLTFRQAEMLVLVFKSKNWIAQNCNFTVFEDFCLSLSWNYRFAQSATRGVATCTHGRTCLPENSKIKKIK